MSPAQMVPHRDERPFVSLPERLERSARREPSAVALVHGERRVPYGALWDDVLSVSAFLRRRGLAPGERVAILLDNCPEYVAAYYGVLAAGGVAVALNTAARARDISRWVEHCGAAFLVADAGHPDAEPVGEPFRARGAVLEVPARAGSGGRGSGSSEPRPPSWEDARRTAPLPPVAVPPDAAAAILYTSGTTGRPKGVTLSHGNLASNVDAILAYLGIGPEDRCMNVLPFFYSYGSSVLHTHLAAGACLLLEEGFVYPHRVVERMSAERVTVFPGVPSTFGLLLSRVDLGSYDLSALRRVTVAGGAMPAATVGRLREALPQAQIFVMYGQTEATARLTYVPPAHLPGKIGSAGIPIPGVEIEVRDEHDRTLPPGHAGEVCARGANVMLGYFGDEEASAAALRGGWLHTGDVGRLDEEGYLWLECRRSDIVKSGAHRISPRDVEEEIARLPGVAEVAVVGVEDALLGQVLKAVIVLEPGASLDEMQVKRHCREQLAAYKVPKIVELAGSLPKTASGKVLRHLLAGRPAEERAS